MIYTAGYSGHQPEALKQKAIDLDAIAIDIRFSPNSRVPYWRKEALESLLGFRYKWCFAFGNRNYRGGDIEIVDEERGRTFVGKLADTQDVILLCACIELEGCHREIVGKIMEFDGYDVEELIW